MNRISLCAISALSVFLLSGCVSQDEADTKMAKGCKAAVEVLIEPIIIKEVKATRFADEDSNGGIFRRITLSVVEKNGWSETDREYNCLYAQQWGIAKTSHIGTLEQISYDDTVAGKEDGNLNMKVDDFMNLVNASQNAMNQ